VRASLNYSRRRRRHTGPKFLMERRRFDPEKNRSNCCFRNGGILARARPQFITEILFGRRASAPNEFIGEKLNFPPVSFLPAFHNTHSRRRTLMRIIQFSTLRFYVSGVLRLHKEARGGSSAAPNLFALNFYLAEDIPSPRSLSIPFNEPDITFLDRCNELHPQIPH
jgi:hypothetical protein